MTFTMVIQLLIVLLALWVGSRYGSLALGAISGIGLAILVFGFGLKPGTPPTDVIYIIIAAVTCAGVLQASGGMDWMIQIAEKMLRKHPDRITFMAPLTTFFLTVLVGTGHVVYTLMPIICDIAAGGHYLFADCRCCSSFCFHLCSKRFPCEQPADYHDHHPRLCLRIDGCCCSLLSSW